MGKTTVLQTQSSNNQDTVLQEIKLQRTIYIISLNKVILRQ